MNNTDPLNLAIATEERIKACKRELDIIMHKYGCMLDVGLIITVANIKPIVRIVPNPRVGLVPNGVQPNEG